MSAKKNIAVAKAAETSKAAPTKQTKLEQLSAMLRRPEDVYRIAADLIGAVAEHDAAETEIERLDNLGLEGLRAFWMLL